MLAGEESRVLKRSVGADEGELGTPKDAIELEAPERAVVAHGTLAVWVMAEKEDECDLTVSGPSAARRHLGNAYVMVGVA